MAPLPEKINGAQSALPVFGPPQVAREQVKGSGSASVEGWVLAPERTVLCILPSLLQFLLRRETQQRSPRLLQRGRG